MTDRSDRNVVWHLFLTSKPYSAPDQAARALMVCGLVGASREIGILLAASLVSVQVWFFFNWYSDVRQGQQGRLHAPAVLLIAVLVCTLPWVTAHGVGACLGLAVYILTIHVYPLKAIRPWAGPFGPAFRALTILGHCFCLVTLVPSAVVGAQTVWAIVSLCILHAARNLLGDVRDIQKDVYELPARFGFRTALWVLRLLLLVGILTAAPSGVSFLPLALSMGLQWMAIELLAIRFGRTKPHYVGYFGHRLFIVLYTVAQAWAAACLGIYPVLCGSLCCAAVLLNGVYALLPGKNYPGFRQLFRS